MNMECVQSNVLSQQEYKHKQNNNNNKTIHTKEERKAMRIPIRIRIIRKKKQ